MGGVACASLRFEPVNLLPARIRVIESSPEMRLDMSYVSIICGDGCQLTDSVETEEDITHVKYVESVLI
jgi:hypothetical protein